MTERDVQLPLISEAAPLIVSPEIFCLFEVVGEPRAWERPGATIRMGPHGPFIFWYVRDEEAKYREAIAWHAKAAMKGRAPTSKPVALLVHAFLRIAPSWKMRERMGARSGALLPTGKPDADNILKVSADSLKNIVWNDDAAVVDARIIKRYSDRPALRVEVREFVPPK
jgi:Holliday junction resolvase RusA-like endonuclease